MKKIITILLFILLFAACENDYKKRIQNSVGMELVYVKPGTFLMGPDYELSYVGREDEFPHKVTLTKGFYMQTTETTIGQWKKFINETKYTTKSEKDRFSWHIGGFRYSHLKKKGFYWKNTGYKYNDDFPVTYVSFDDCLAFLKWLSKKEGSTYRLPTEAEWEYACRAGTTTHFPGGNLQKSSNYYEDKRFNKKLDKIAWYSANSGKKTNQVGLKEPNPWGLFDILGNVQEFCLDEYMLIYPNKHVVDPLFTENKDRGEKLWVIRGGSWNHPQGFATSSIREGADTGDNTIGFRVVKEVSKKDIK
jgi:formylglycine-generating enzyme required for sulfatase activity